MRKHSFLFWKYGKENKIRSSRLKYKNAEQYIRHILDDYPQKDAAAILDYFIRMVKSDIAFELRTKIIYDGPVISHDCPRFDPCLQFSYFDEHGRCRHTHDHCIPNKRVDFTEETEIFLFPWHYKRMNLAVCMAQKLGFAFDEYNHLSYFYKPFDFIYLYNGNHSICAFSALKKGCLITEEIDFTPVFPHVKTDGAYWLDAHTGRILSEIQDFRIAVLFELCKAKAYLAKE